MSSVTTNVQPPTRERDTLGWTHFQNNDDEEDAKGEERTAEKERHADHSLSTTSLNMNYFFLKTILIIT